MCNADNEKDVDNLFKQIKKITKTIDCLINNVGIAGPTGAIEKLNIARSSIPAVTHLDYSARVQTIFQIKNLETTFCK